MERLDMQMQNGIKQACLRNVLVNISSLRMRKDVEAREDNEVARRPILELSPQAQAQMAQDERSEGASQQSQREATAQMPTSSGLSDKLDFGSGFGLGRGLLFEEPPSNTGAGPANVPPPDPARLEQQLMERLLRDLPVEVLIAARQIMKGQMKSATQPTRTLRNMKAVDGTGHITGREDFTTIVEDIFDAAPPMLEQDP